MDLFWGLRPHPSTLVTAVKRGDPYSCPLAHSTKQNLQELFMLPVPAGYKELTDLHLCHFCHLPGWPRSTCFCLGRVDFHLAPVYS